MAKIEIPLLSERMKVFEALAKKEGISVDDWIIRCVEARIEFQECIYRFKRKID